MSDLCDQRMQNLIEGGLYQMNELEENIEQLESRIKQLDSLNHMMINGQHRLEEVVLKYQDRIKDQAATIDALLAQNKTQMLELEKLEEQNNYLVGHLRDSVALADCAKLRVDELEAWQKEAVPQLKRLQDIINVKLGDYSRSFGMREVTYQQLDDLNNLIKQAEDN